LEITDSGRGPHDGPGTGHGLVGMRERTAMFGGKLEAARGEGGGFTVRARLPVPTPASA
jgi:signal transduction histidine kinase